MKPLKLDRKIIFTILSVLIVSQLVYFYINVQSFKTSYQEAVQSNLNTVGNSLQINLDDLLQKGISIRKFFGLKTLLQEIIEETAELSFIAISDLSGNQIYYCDRKAFLQEPALAGHIQKKQLDGLQIQFVLSGRNKEPQGVLTLGIDQMLIRGHVTAIAMDTGTIILISILAILDFLFFIIAYTITIPVQRASLEIQEAVTTGSLNRSITLTNIDFFDTLIRQFEKMYNEFSEKWKRIIHLSSPLSLLQKNSNSALLKDLASSAVSTINRFHFEKNEQIQTISILSPSLIRPAIFLFIFAEALSISFLPLFAKQLYQPIQYLSREIVLGLPISSFMLFTTISLPVGGLLAEKIGHKKTFLTGAVISALGLFLTGSANTILFLILYRAIVGFGFGIVFMTTQIVIVDQTTIENRAEGMAIFLSAFYGGTLCGSAIGGMISDQIGFRALFFLGAVIAIGSTLFLFFIISKNSTQSNDFHKPSNARNSQGTGSKKSIFFRNALALFSDRNFSALVLFQSIPNKICLIGFVYYLAPLFFESLGSIQSDTGRYIMLYSLVMILFSQSISRWSDRFSSPKFFVFWGGLFSGVALLPCFFFQGVFWIALGITILGFSHALSVSNQAKLASQLHAVNQIGLGPGLGIYRQAERVGNVLAPIISGALISQVGYAKALALMGVYMSLSSILFLIIFSDNTET